MGPFKHQKNTLPAPCLAVNQRIDKQNAMVLNHMAIYEHSLSQITESNTVQNALIILNPFMAAPSLASLARAILSIRRRAARRWGC
ncbi:aryl sulfotransferase [Salmonella enterica subsp. enterica serovar Waycross]|nr:aryl sulfotransferase [Salmonella enterica subsp. enterica serovar Waycross]